MPITNRFDQAIAYASDKHRTQIRKGTDIPYIAHLLGVASIVLENGGSESEAVAALLHDAPEDQGGKPTLNEIRGKFGDEVAETVAGCTDTFDDPKPDWMTRKVAYLQHLRTASKSILIVSCADKLHNARAILADYREIGDELWSRFSHKNSTDNLWYYESLVEAYRANPQHPRQICDELERTVLTLKELIRTNSERMPRRPRS